MWLRAWARKLMIEPLEDRLAPAVVTWDGGGGDFRWENALNWSSDALPGPADDVQINTAGITITHGTDSVIHDFTLAGTTIDGPGGLTVNGVLTLGGLAILRGGGSLTAAGGGNITPNLAGGFDLDNFRLVNPAGQTIDWYGGNNSLDNGAAIDNYGTIHLHDGTVLDGHGAFNNYGRVTRSGADGATFRLDLFNNPGSVTVSDGFLTLGASDLSTHVVHGGSISAAAGTTLSFDGVDTFTPSATIHAAALRLGGMLNLPIEGGPANVRFAQISAQSVSLSAALSVSPADSFHTLPGARFLLVNNSGTSAVNGTFSGLAEGAVITLADGTQIQISYQGTCGSDGQGNDVVLTVIHAPVQPGRLQGLVWEDFNNDGQVDFGERAIQGAAITLTGTDYLGNAVNQDVTTDAQGFYEFVNLWPGTYTISEAQPAGFADGRDTLGAVNGQPSGDASVNDTFSGIVLPSGGVGIGYNFGERPTAGGTVHHGQTATIGFWQNRNGQELIKALNGGPGSTQLGNWLAATFSHLYGAAAGGNNLAGKTNAEVAAFFVSLTNLNGPKLDAQVLAAALAAYVTDEGLAGATAAAYGFEVTAQGVGYATFNVGNSGAAFGAANNTTMTVLDILLAADVRARNGLLYDQDGSGTISAQEQVLRNLANQVFAGINGQGDI